MSIKHAVLFVAKWLGGFRLAEFLTRNDLRILAYHGVWFSDKHFGNHLFVTEDLFRQRMEWLLRSRFDVIPLQEAIERREQGLTTCRSAVITIDDGWYGTLTHMVPVCEAFELPATLYLYTGAVDSQRPLWHIMLPAMLELTDLQTLVEVSAPFDLDLWLDLSSEAGRSAAAEALLVRLNDLSERQREQFTCSVAAALGLDFDALVASRQFSFANYDELAEARVSGLDLQLHTHNHHLDPLAPEGIVQEIELNREKFLDNLGLVPTHFCYPSGIWCEEMFTYLEACQVRSATVAEVGLAAPSDNCYALKRIMDGQLVSQLEFESEMAGFSDLMRRAFHRFR